MANCLPPGTVAVGGVWLDQVRSGPLSQALPAAWLTATEPFQQASQAWVAYDGKEPLVIAAGRFPVAPPGAVLVGHGLALAGSSSAVRAAKEQRASGRTGSATLIEKASRLRNEPIWAVARGDAPVHLPGNTANLERALRFTDYAAASVAWDSAAVRMRLVGYCPTKERAQELEESLRAMVTLGRKAVRAGGLKAALESVRIERQESTVLASLTAAPEVVREMLR
jgi:hypothetical protein